MFSFLATNDFISNNLNWLYRRNDCIKANKYFNDDELKAERVKIANQYEGIWDYTDADVIRLERELEQLSVEEELYEDLVVKIKWVNGSALEVNVI